jgi:hypothetical protein
VVHDVCRPLKIRLRGQGFPVNDLIGLLDDQDMRDASEALRAFLKCSFQSAIWTVHDCQFLSKGAKDLRPEILRQMSLSA